MKKIIPTLIFLPQCSLALQALNETELSDVTGEGLGATFDNVVLYSEDLGQPNDFEINVFLDENRYNGNYLRISELRLNKSGAEPGEAGSGGQFGTYLDPFFLGLLVDIEESYGSLHDHDGNAGTDFVTQPRTHTALYTGFPAADLESAERNFYYYNDPNPGDYDYENRAYYQYKGTPEGFFDAGNRNNIGNFFTQAAAYQSDLDRFESTLDGATDKFDLHLRIDSINDTNRALDYDDQFLASIDLEGFRLYGTETYIWSHSRKGEEDNRINRVGEVILADYGLAIASTAGLRADRLTINADPSGAAASALSLEGVDVYLPLGTVDQPLTISTVQFQQQSRGNWKTDGNGNRLDLLPATTQLRVEITGLPQGAIQAEQGHITVQQLSFGDPNDEEIITGYEDIYLRNSSGAIAKNSDGTDAIIENVKHRAFVPKTVIYNEQVKLYNDANPSTPIPYIPNENTLEIKGLEIQRLVFTTQDLNR